MGGILSFLAGVGGAMEETGFAGVKAALMDENSKLADARAEARAIAAGKRSEEATIRSEGRQETRTLAGEKRAITNAVAMEKAAGPARLENAKAAKQAEIDLTTDPKNTEKIAKAEASKAKFAAESGAELNAWMVKQPDYLKNLEKLALANPATRAQIAASMASANLSAYKLGQEKTLAGAREELSKATDPVAQKAVKEKIKALEWSASSEAAQMAATASMVKTLESAKSSLEGKKAGALDPTEQARIQTQIDGLQSDIASYSAQYKKLAGIAEAPGAKGGGSGVEIGTGTDAGTFRVDGVTYKGNPKTVAEARALAVQGKAKTKPGVLDTPGDKPATAREKYLKAVSELNALKGGILFPTPEKNAGAIKAKEEEVRRLLQETY